MTHLSDSQKSAAHAIWAWTLANGRVPDVYSRFDDDRTAKVRKHMPDCAIDLERSTTPTFGATEEFDDTFAPNRERPAVVGHLVCACGKISLDIAVHGEDGQAPSLSDIIIAVVGG